LILIFLFFLALNQENSSLIAQINNQKITQKDLDYQIKVDSCYGLKNQAQEPALIEIINKFFEEQVLNSAFENKISDKELEKKAEWVDKNTKAPEILECVKKVFGEDRKKYLDFYIKPTLVNPRLHLEFSLSPRIHQREIEEIKAIKKDLDTGKKLEDFSNYQKWEIPKDTDFPTDPLVDKVIKNLKLGQVWLNIIKDDFSYKIVRLLEEDKEKYYLDGVIVQKMAFDPWFQDYVKRNIKIEILDQELLTGIKTNHPNLWWVSSLYVCL